jgi:type II secretory pathway component PulF
MASSIQLALGKNEFKGRRLDVYSSLAQETKDGGSRKNKTLKETFERYAKRELKRKNACGYVYDEIAKSLGDGKTFSEALRPFVPKEEALIIEAGEASGRISSAFDTVTRQARSSAEIKKAIRQGIFDPMVGVVSFLILSIICGMKVWPPLLSAIDEQYWPSWVWPMVYGQIAFASSWPLYLGSVMGFIAFIVWSLPNLTGNFRRVLDYIPPYTIYRLRQSASLLGVVAGLLNAGMELSAAFRRISETSNPYMRWHIARIVKKMDISGTDGILALNTGLFTIAVMDRIEDAAASREFDETLSYVGTIALDSVIDKVKFAVTSFVAVLVGVNGMAMLYFTAVQVIGMQIALNAFIAAQGG